MRYERIEPEKLKANGNDLSGFDRANALPNLLDQ
jgi:hypothetical protein